ncbi:UPF0287-domain-containing protein [Cystobasidium minutum MCA 4210]|uniref:UPF0287-domain-containing protein n=1 Tax=Cystobasidium minutum MCA 4210 TaxID=1397322 RepID=UPI0034CF43D5|eukprot:jgi/Rhomi1/196374/gm1.4588_g
MHPPLAHHQHEACQKEIIALTDCHSSWKKFFGQCNGLKNELTLCLRAERLDRRKQNHEEAKAKRAKAQAAWKTIDEES